MPLFINTNTQRPNRLTSKKDKTYHLQYARWALQSMNHPTYRNFITKSLVNWSFYKGGDGQWIFDEDLESFFLDESGDVRNRLKISKNLIRPMVEQYVGNAIRLSYKAKADGVGDFVINRREEALKELKYYESIAQTFPEFEGLIRDRVPLGDTPEQTEELFDASYRDELIDTINGLLDFVEKDIDIETIKVVISRYLAITGLGIYKGYEQNQNYIGEAIDPVFFFWDMSARKQDLSDSEYMGEWYYLDAPSVFERFQNLTKEEREAIERYSVNESLDIHRVINNYYSISGAKIPVYEVYWKDTEEQEYGYVQDPYGYPYFTRINHEQSEYTDKDLIEPPENAYKKILKKGEKKTKVFVDTLRYCIFIPKEEIGVSSSEDIVLEYGEVEYQEKYKLDPSNVQFPYKCYTWAYDKGEVLSPIDDAIQPQRFINRLLSVAESHINNSRGTGTIISKDAIDTQDGEETVIRNINKSKPIFVDTTRTGSVQNTVGVYGSNLGQGTMAMFNVIQEMQRGLQEVTGINEAMTGTKGGSDALVGVINAQIQRGSIMQEPFYWALASILKQAYQHAATVGKWIYKDNPRKISIIVGDRGKQVLNVSEDVLMEDFRIFIERSENKSDAITNGNNLLFTLLQAGLIDAPTFSELFNRADADMIASAMRRYHKQKQYEEQLRANAEPQAAQAQQQQMMEVMAQQQAEKDHETQIMLDDKERDRQHELELAKFKEDKKTERDIVRSELKK